MHVDPEEPEEEPQPRVNFLGEVLHDKEAIRLVESIFVYDPAARPSPAQVELFA